MKKKSTRDSGDTKLNYEGEIPDETAAKEDKVEDIMVKLQEKEKEAAENYDKYLRAVAELENFKRRAAKDKADSLKYGQENFIRDMLPHIDSLERALEHAGNSDDFDAFKKGLKLVQDQLLVCLEKHGVEKIEACGKDFDPNVHEAMLQVESQEHDNNKVVEELESGYLLHGRLLRPAKVSVNKRTKQENRDEDEKAEIRD